ncbi:MAG: hypothetical protein OEQ81_07180 [Flavobacteriaceae bacterium]|nr:hypothetical protein [Flavobacteriaceae bacterium]
MTNDSTYMPGKIAYYTNGLWQEIECEIRARGNFRKKNCFYIPLKIKIGSNTQSDGLFDDKLKFKLVLPCKIEMLNDDAVIKEYLAYKIFKELSPVYFQTRLVDLEWVETSSKRDKSFKTTTLILEDVDEAAKRLGIPEIRRNIPALQQDDVASVRLSLFQYMIGNTDYSTKGRHNIKLLFQDGKIIPVPFDFDLSGLVNASYAHVSGANDLSKNITEVTQRAYKGYVRDRAIFYQVRDEMLHKETQILEEINSIESLLEDKRDFKRIHSFVREFFDILREEKKFEKRILRHARQS